LNGDYAPFTHTEDRYLFSYIPSGSKVIAHAERKFVGNDFVFEWESRDSTGTSEDFSVLSDALNPGIAALLLSMFDDNDDNE
jgi:hypothetical protein